MHELGIHYPGQVVVSIDARNNKVMCHGWTEETIYSPLEVAIDLQDRGVAAIIFTDIDLDDDHPDATFAMTTQIVNELHIPVISSGAVKTLDDISTLRMLPNSEGWVMSTHSEGVCFSKAVPDSMPDLEAFSVQFEQWRQQYLVPLLPVDKGISARQAEKYVMKKLKNFPVERKTPFEALQLIMEVKKVLELANG